MEGSRQLPEDQQIVHELMLLFKRFRNNRMQIVKFPEHQKINQGKLLMLLAETNQEKGMKVSQLSQHMGVTSPFVTQLLNSMESKQLIERRTDQKDKRIVRVFLTEEGKQQAKEVKTIIYKKFVGLVEYLGIEESRQLIALWNKSIVYFEGQHEGQGKGQNNL